MKSIMLTQGLYAYVDDEDHEFINQWDWFAHKSKSGIGTNYYAVRGVAVNKKTIFHKNAH